MVGKKIGDKNGFAPVVEGLGRTGCSGPKERSKMFWLGILFILIIIPGVLGIFPETTLRDKVFGGISLFIAGGIAGGLLVAWLKEGKKGE